MPTGEVLSVAQVWGLSKQWYSSRLSPAFKGRSLAEAHDIFERLGLVSPFWRADASG